jgi:HAD superfamily hydrolase (TIGR01549 family)
MIEKAKEYAIKCHTDTCHYIGFRKPEAGAYQTILDYSGLKPKQLLMIGDSKVSDYEGAMNCGIPAILKDKDLSILTQNL